MKTPDTQKIVFVTGKGGVGKSLVSAARALSESQQGKRVLLVEIGSHRFFESALSLKSGGSGFFSWRDQVQVVNWQGEDCLREYVLYYVKLEKLADLFFENKILKSLIYASPALNELSLLGKITSGVRHFGAPMPFDTIIVDSYSTGHFLALLRAPEGMQEAIQLGPMNEKCKEIIRVLRDPQFVEYDIVTLAEEMPIVEALELYESIERGWGIKPKMICNRLISEEVMGLVNSQEVPTPFRTELKIKKEIQEKSLSQLKEKQIPFASIPFIYSKESTDIAQKISTHLKGDL